ncbi:SDR family NAD(P)-dependent oxidoreductase [Leucobacter sp. Z1108]|uniref:SDR family NAD(P)-dependent oxidoreductase n=1 Tax=Leucobacter sp. Z1108 TaxID=3439066 RepID=UPI003F2BCED2
MHELRFDGQVAVIAGAGRGLGKGYAELLAARGARVVVNNRIRPGTESETPVAEEVVAAIEQANGTAVADTSDVGTKEGAQHVIATAIEHFGRVDIVLNNAGIVHFYKFEDYPDDEFDHMLSVQVGASWHLTRAAWPYMIAQGYGRVVNTVSRGAFFGDPQGAAYAASKGAAYGLTRALAVEGEPHGIRVNAISPTAWTPLYQRAPDVSPERRALLERDFTVDRVAPVVAFLAHESCDFSGQVIGAAGQHVSRMYIAQTAGTRFESRPSPEQVGYTLPEIWDERGRLPWGSSRPGPEAAAHLPRKCQLRRGETKRHDVTGRAHGVVAHRL